MSKSKTNQFKKPKFIRQCKQRSRKSLGVTPSTKQINEVLKNWIEHYVIEQVVKGHEVKLDKHSTIEVIGKPVMDNKRAVSLFSNGRIVSKGRLKKNDGMGKMRKNHIYKIVYKNKLADGKNLHFNAHPIFRKKVNYALENTATYFTLQ